jgi:two-component system nitrogen regulation response regulator NtrX
MAPGEAKEAIRADMLPPQVGAAAPAVLKLDRSSEIMTLPLREAREVVRAPIPGSPAAALRRQHQRTANFVGMERSALHRKLKFLGVHAEDRANPSGTVGNA